jgi:NADH-quinone oxidoreductase subunit A
MNAMPALPAASACKNTRARIEPLRKTPMPVLLGYILLFVVVGAGFILVHLLAGKLIRPAKPNAEKMTIYECGEPTIGSAWVQFDLRFYVVALLFVIFDVEVVFFFPWAVVFGKATLLGKDHLSAPERIAQTRQLFPPYAAAYAIPPQRELPPVAPQAARQLAWFAFWDILIFFGVLLVGFAYLWKRGDLDWVRSTAAEDTALARAKSELPAEQPEELIGVGTAS